MSSESPVHSKPPAPGVPVEHLRVDVTPRDVTPCESTTNTEDRTVTTLAKTKPDPTHRNAQSTCLVILASLAVFYTMFFARAILLPITLAVVLSLVLKPITKRLHAWGLPNVLSTLLVMVVFTGGTIVGVRAVWEPAKTWISQAPESLRKVREQLSGVAGPLSQLMKAKSDVEETMAMPEDEESITLPFKLQVEKPPASTQLLSSRLLSSTGSFATAATITLSLLFFLLAAGDQFLEKAVQIKHTWREKRDVVLLIKEVERKMSTYLGAITVINVGLGVLIGFGLWLIDMPNPVLWGVMAALLNYIPFAGLVLGALIVTVVAIGEFSSLGHALLAPAIYLGVNGIEANFVTPAVLGRSISLNPVVILLAVFLGGWIWGIGGIFLAVPLLLVAKISCDSNESLKPIGVFLAQ